MRNSDFTLRLLAAVLIGFLMPIWTYAQNVSVTGTVLDETGEPLIGATVLQKNSSNGTSTDLDGKFKLSVPAKAKLVFSYVGYTSQEIALNGQTDLKVTMKPNADMLDEVVVVGYG